MGKIKNQKVQYLDNPIGLGCRRPVFSYEAVFDRRGARQSAYRILVASTEKLLENEKADLWDSGKRQEGRCFGIVYEGEALRSRQEAFWKVCVWDERDQESAWSEPAHFEMGLLEEEDWKAEWIGRGDAYEGDKSASPAIAGSFVVSDLATVRKARLYISGLGLFWATLNGRQVTDALYEPGESEYERRVYYVTYDVTGLLQEGENVLGVLLGNGQYANFAVDPVMKMPDGSLSEKHRYQKDDTSYLRDGICGDVKLLAQVEVEREDGRREIVAASREGWKIADGPVTFQNWYGGEDYDAVRALEMKGWDTAKADRSGWADARRMEPPKGRLAAKEFPPIRIWERWQAKQISRLPGNRWLVDMGKNSAGFICLKLKDTQGYAGQKVQLYPAEVVKADGSGVDQSSCTQSCDTLYDCRVQDSYTIAGTGTEEWHPHFCYHGFQYVEVSGFPGEPSLENFEGCAVRLMNEKVSDFETGNSLINRINQITERSIESNMMCSFTDCPQIEKLGWLETTQLMFSSMAAGYDIRAWIPKILADMRDAQVTGIPEDGRGVKEDPKKYPGCDFGQLEKKETESAGFVPGIAPEYFRIRGLYKDPNWGGACIMTPWYDYMEYGEEGILRQNYTMMKAYLNHLEEQSVNGVLRGYAQMGEWGQLNEQTPAALVATCAFYLQARTLADIAGVLGQEADQARYAHLADTIREGFYADEECFQEKTGIYGNGSQASYGCVLFSGIIKPQETERALAGLVQAVEATDWHLTSGEVGLKQVFCALASHERNDVVYRMVMNPTQPSYRYFVAQGLTTLPEYWNYTELWHGMGRSRNHAMMGHVKEWLCRFVLGIAPLEAGYRKVRIHPWLSEEIGRVKGSILTPFGSVCLACEKKAGVWELHVDIPAGSTAQVWIPYRNGQHCFLDGEEIEETSGLLESKTEAVLQVDVKLPLKREADFLVASVPSGTYVWTVRG